MGSRFPAPNFVPRPRAPPRLIRPPSPLAIERPPQPIVPDVSLIMDSAATSFQSNNSEYSASHDYSPPGQSRNGQQDRLISPRNVSCNNSSVNQTGNSSSNNINFVNYYPTPPENSNSRNNNSSSQMSRSRSFSKVDSGNGSSTELFRLQNAASSSSMNETSVSENLPLDSSEVVNVSKKPEQSYNSCAKDHESIKADIASVLKTVTAQDENIQVIKMQLQNIVAFQEKFLVHLIRKGASVSKSVQTDNSSESKQPEVKTGKGNEEDNSSARKQLDKSSSLQRKRSISRKSETASPPLRNTSPVASQQEMPVLRNNRVASLSVPEDKKTGEDVSTILRNLQISNVQPPSMYSETSMRSIECPPFNDDTFQNEVSLDIGPSASAVGSESEEETGDALVPTQTYYNNLLSTVNRILDGGQRNANNGNVQIQQQNTGGARPASASKRQCQSGQSSKGSVTSRASSQKEGTASYSSGSSSSSTGSKRYQNDNKENCPSPTSEASALVNKILEHQKSASNTERNTNAVESTKQYLQSIGVQFDSPNQNAPPPTSQPLGQNQNYMIQQNVYNSYYIPTVNCVPVISESVDSNSGLMDNLARKYISPGERNQYELMAGKRNELTATAETTVYGMTPGNLSFATKEYLKRHGLVGQTEPASIPVSSNRALFNPAAAAAPAGGGPDFNAVNKSDKILDMTAIRNQPKLL